MLTAIATEPIDVIKTRIQTQKRAKDNNKADADARGKAEGNALTAVEPMDFGYNNLAHGLAKAVRDEGILALWRGMLPRLLNKALGSSIWFPIYMCVRELLDPAAV